VCKDGWDTIEPNCRRVKGHNNNDNNNNDDNNNNSNENNKIKIWYEVEKILHGL